MKHVDLSYWPMRTMSVLTLFMGMYLLNDQSSGPMSLINTNPLIYGLVAMGVGLVIIIWFMYETRISYLP